MFYIETLYQIINSWAYKWLQHVLSFVNKKEKEDVCLKKKIIE